MQAIRVTFVALPPPFDIWNGAKLWVGARSSVSQAGPCVGSCYEFGTFHAATLQCEPYYGVWIPKPLHVFHEGIVPEGSYRIEVIDETCLTGAEGNFSPPLELTTARWGDTIRDCATIPCPPPDGVVNIIDVVAILGRFASELDSIHKSRADLEPGCLDLIVNISDVMFAVGGFQGLSYPFEPTALDPCDSTCISPLP